FVPRGEPDVVDDRRGQEAGVAHALPLRLPQLRGVGDLDGFVVYAHTWAAVAGLPPAHQVVLDRLPAADAQDVVRHQRAGHQGVALPDVVVAVDAELLAVRDQVLALFADGPSLFIHGLDEDGPLAAPFLADAHLAGHLGHDRRLARAACLEDFRDARQAAGDVRNAADLARGLGQ